MLVEVPRRSRRTRRPTEGVTSTSGGRESSAPSRPVPSADGASRAGSGRDGSGHAGSGRASSGRAGSGRAGSASVPPRAGAQPRSVAAERAATPPRANAPAAGSPPPAAGAGAAGTKAAGMKAAGMKGARTKVAASGRRGAGSGSVPAVTRPADPPAQSRNGHATGVRPTGGVAVAAPEDDGRAGAGARDTPDSQSAVGDRPPSPGGPGTRPLVRPPVNRRRVARKMALTAGALGVVVALLSLPLVGAIGLFAKGSADHFLSLPSELITPPLPQSSTILASDGSVIATLRGSENRIVVPGNQIPKVMREAIVSIEDSRFYQHGGVDPQGVLRAALRNSEAGGVAQGGSTLTQQYVKNVLLQNARTSQEREVAAGDSLDRKI
ncbi:biosynthetic peptidoglycan transglycosylase, partial [Frankia canadensis]|uniref:biosynthetic peptidoglycan transglycosylase n=1 Tax=Frankia canadensis TaxID=1836972 RepID=UPI001A9C43CD